ncbi:MAG: thioredoxin family protein [Planctomycetes bacterium]|nr:thioredoxin family protein [Planctomycetota bacterium]
MRTPSLALVALVALSVAGCSSDAQRSRAGSTAHAAPAAAPSLAPTYAPSYAPAYTPAASAPTPGGAIPWDANSIPLEQALAAGRAAGKPVAVYFLSSSCGYCAKLQSTTLTDGRVQAEMRAFYNVFMDPRSPAGSPLSREHAKYGFPTVAIFAPSGAVKTYIIGYERPDSMLTKLRAAH